MIYNLHDFLILFSMKKEIDNLNNVIKLNLEGNFKNLSDKEKEDLPRKPRNLETRDFLTQ